MVRKKPIFEEIYQI